MATYYVDPTGPNGVGSEADPFNALPANFSSAGYVNGDIFLFKRGTTYTPSWGNTPGTPGDAFTVNRTIRFGAYGTGDRPIISANYTGSAGGRLFRVYVTGCVFEDLHFANTNNCHTIYTTNAFADLTVQRCKATQIRGSSSGNEGFVVLGPSSALTGTAIVTDNEVDGIANDGIEVRCTGTTIIARNTVKNCSLDTITGDCVAAVGNSALLHIYDNNLDHTNKDTKQCIIQDGGSTGFAIIENNICNGYFQDGSFDHTGIYLSLPGIIRNNFIRTWRSGVFLNVANVRVEGNVIIQGGGTALTGAVYGSSAGMVVQNNVIWRIAGTDVADAAIRNNTSNATNLYRNNIIVGFNTGIRRGALAVDSYNDFHQVTTAVRDASYLPVAAGTGTVYVDPQLNSDGSIRSSSPVATAGTYVSGVTLANGRLRPNFVPIGAYMAVLPRTARV